MLQKDIHQFLKSFFIENDCSIEEEHEGYITVQLTIDMDKEIMNRPFYWTYIEKTGGIPAPQKITFITDDSKAPANIKGEKIHFGSPRLHQLFRTTKKFASHIRLYEVPVHAKSSQQIALHPWLMMNVKISYQCDRKKEMIRSFGLNLINGILVDRFFYEIETLHLQPKIPDYCFTITPIITLPSGIKRIENFITNELIQQEHQWAEKARKRWEEDLRLLDHFYEEYEEKPETYYTEKEALREQYEPKIQVEVINGGIIYLQGKQNYNLQ